MPLSSFAQNVRRRMPEDAFAYRYLLDKRDESSRNMCTDLLGARSQVILISQISREASQGPRAHRQPMRKSGFVSSFIIYICAPPLAPLQSRQSLQSSCESPSRHPKELSPNLFLFEATHRAVRLKFLGAVVLTRHVSIR